MADKKISALTAATTPLAGTEVLPIVQSSTTKKVSVADLTSGRDISTTGIIVSSDTGNIELNWAAGSNHTLGSKFSTAFFTGMRVDADTRNTDIVSLDATGVGNVRIRTGTTEATRLNVDPTGNVTVNTGNLVIGTAGKGIDFSADGQAAGMTSELLDDYEEGTFTPFSYGTSSAGVGTYTATNGFYVKVGSIVYFSIEINQTNHTGTGSIRIGGLPFASKSGEIATIAPLSVNLALDASNTLGAQIPGNTSFLILYNIPVGGGAAGTVAMDTSFYLTLSGTYTA